MTRASITAGLCILALTAGLASAWWWFERPDPLPEFALPDLSGDIRRSEEWRGEVLVLNFWATWCKPCREEMPMLASLQSELGDAGLQVVGVAVDELEPVRRFAAEYGIDYPLLVDLVGAVRLQDAVNGGAALPMTVVADREGLIRARVPGKLDRRRLEAIVQPLL